MKGMVMNTDLGLQQYVAITNFITGKVADVLNEAPYHENIYGSGDRAPSTLTSALDGGEWSALLLVLVGWED
jgi:hypothetical protein